MTDLGFKKIWRFRFMLLRADATPDDPRKCWGSKRDDSAGIIGTREILAVTVIEEAPYPGVMLTAWRFKLGVYYISPQNESSDGAAGCGPNSP